MLINIIGIGTELLIFKSESFFGYNFEHFFNAQNLYSFMKTRSRVLIDIRLHFKDFSA